MQEDPRRELAPRISGSSLISSKILYKKSQASQEVFKLGFEEKFFDFLQECMIEVERKIKRNKQRLDQNQDEDAPINAVSSPGHESLSS